MLPQPLPLIFSLTHAGTQSPKNISGPDLDSPPRGEEALAKDLFALAHRIQIWKQAEIAPTYVDLDEPPGRAIPPSPAFNRQMKNLWVKEYYQPYHDALTQSVKSGTVRAGFDCYVHRLKTEDEFSFNLGLSNHGDRYGEGDPATLTCPAQMLRDLRDILKARFADWPDFKMVLNPDLGQGGYLYQLHARPEVPWIRLDLDPRFFQTSEGKILPGKIVKFPERLGTVLVIFCKLQTWI